MATDSEDPLKEVREETEGRLGDFLDAKKKMDEWLRLLQGKEKDKLEEWQISHPNTTPVLPSRAVEFVKTACRLKPYLLFWEFLRFRFMRRALARAPDYIRESLQLHALINAYTLSLQFIGRRGGKSRWYYTQPFRKVYGEFGVFPTAIRNLEGTIKKGFPVEKSDSIIVLVGKKKKRLDGIFTKVADGEKVNIDGEEVDVDAHYHTTDMGRKLSDAYGITEYPAVIYNGYAIEGCSDLEYARSIGEDSEDSIAEEVSPHFEVLENIDALEALEKAIKKKAGVEVEAYDTWRMPWEGWMEPHFSKWTGEHPDMVSPDYYLVMAACHVRQSLNMLKEPLATRYANLFRTRPEMFTSLRVLTQATHDIVEKDLRNRLEWDERAGRMSIRSSNLWQDIMLFVTSLWEVKGFRELLNLNITDLSSPKDRVVFIDEKDCNVCEKFYKRRKLKRWRRNGKWRELRGEFHDNGKSTMGKVWLRRLYLVTSPKEVEWFHGMKMKRQKVKTRDTPFILWGTRTYGNEDGEGFGDDVTIMEILNKLLGDHKDELMRSYRKQLRGLRRYHRRRFEERYPSSLGRGRSQASRASRPRGEQRGEEGEKGERPRQPHHPHPAGAVVRGQARSPISSSRGKTRAGGDTPGACTPSTLRWILPSRR